MASELAKLLLDAGFPAAKPVRDHELFGIPTLEELITPLSASIPTNGKRTADLFQSTVKSRIGQDMAQPPPKHWQNFGSPFTRIITRNHWGAAATANPPF